MGLAAADRARRSSGRSCARSPAGTGCARASPRCSTRRKPATACTSTSACSTPPGAPALYDAARPASLSELGERFAAGILLHAEALSALTAPSPPSAARLEPHRWSAGAVCLAQRNREALLRLPAAERACRRRSIRPAAPRVPRRGRDGQSLPGARGDRAGGHRRGAPGAARAADPRPRPRAAHRRRRRPATASARLPASLADALAALARDATARGWMPPLLYDAYVAVKRSELEAVAALDLAGVCRRYADVY